MDAADFTKFASYEGEQRLGSRVSQTHLLYLLLI